MEIPDVLIKSLTILLFTILMLGFVLLKSGCRYDRYIKKSAKAVIENGIEHDFEALDAKGELDTVRYQESDTFVIIKEYIPSSKSVRITNPSEIFKILTKDSLPTDFKPTSIMNIHPVNIAVWEKMQELKQKKKDKEKKSK